MMKKIVLAFILITATASCHKSNDNSNITASTVPSGVTGSFNTRYPAASGQIEWEKENGNTYKVKFFLGLQRWQAIFNADGSFVSESKI